MMSSTPQDMALEARIIPITPAIQVSSVWAVPPEYRSRPDAAVILAHGAGNDMNHPFMEHFHRAIAAAGHLCVKFNFPYKELGRKAPDRMPMLEATWRAVLQAVRDDADLAPKRLFLAGKSMGGRVASHLAAQGEACAGLIFLGYPLHPAKQPEKLRVDHWPGLHCPVLFVEGTRDTLCDLDTLKTHLPGIPGSVSLHIVEGGDHSFKVPASLGKDQAKVWNEAASAVSHWLKSFG
ncbi:alpha/beta hydrolase family protein [Methyloterricola oryzae]|uniref:alpha/beta hydrolase family protein n=1 Tax=Methyloterricola oryzae TaxID=1495050 RepID=UPI00069BFAA9|nr:alpha/beta family hydrolase [Methyloterricola oryzae]